ncbi:uncharacterized protein BX663DRAFT_515769 [Cokeromyces recurvatus]|uniref:uncharacterized protein n=1 Tax=Cokeromyces recurvatus TaxID=90255 RepID=UPI0022205BBD|nr:uncharacterized protein BX663DRAFT_515769 [Cokeromyces recurvatus]KAI7900935.1 hypothetical protein BX663DRAFT_515769 [Cokeromyces recurvatus]
MLYSQIINVLPHRILTSLWTKQETRISLSHLINYDNKNEQPAAITSNFLCNELPIRYTHILRLLSTLSPETLKSPIIRHVAHNYLRDICTLLHPSLKETSPKAFINVLTDLRQRQSINLIRLKYALLSSSFSSTTNTIQLLENLNTIGTGIYLLLDQYVSWNFNKNDHVQPICPEEIAQKAVSDAHDMVSTTLGTSQIPKIEIIRKNMYTKDTSSFVYIPSVFHRILYETSLLALKAHVFQQQGSSSSPTKWFSWLFNKSPPKLSMCLFGGPTSIGCRLETSEPLIERDLLPDIPRDVLGIPTSASVLSTMTQTQGERRRRRRPQQQQQQQRLLPHTEWMNGWQVAKSLANHWGGQLNVVSAEGLGSSLYLSLDRDTSLREQYPTNSNFIRGASAELLRHDRRVSAIGFTSVQAATAQLDAFLYAISDHHSPPPPNWHETQQQQPYHHSVSLMAAVGHA